MIAAALLLALIGEPSPRIIDVDERAPLLMMEMTPKGVRVPIATTRLYRVAAEALQHRSRLELRSPEQLGIDTSRLLECELDRRLTCWVEEARRTRPAEAPMFLLVMSLVESKEGTVEVAGVLVDLERAGKIIDRALDEPAGSVASVENRIFESVITARGTTSRLDDDAELLQLLDRFLAGDFAGAFAEHGVAEPAGAITIAGGRAGLEIAIDDALVGITGPGTTRLEALAPGARRVSIRDPERHEELLTEAVMVRPQTPVEVRIPPPAVAPDRTRMKVGLFGGVAIAAVGIAISAVGIGLAPDRDVVTPCVGADCTEQRTSRLAGTCDLAHERSSECANGGLLLLPLGYSVALSGALWSIGSVLFPDSELAFWLSLVAGVGLGAATYGISSAL